MKAQIKEIKNHPQSLKFITGVILTCLILSDATSPRAMGANVPTLKEQAEAAQNLIVSVKPNNQRVAMIVAYNSKFGTLFGLAREGTNGTVAFESTGRTKDIGWITENGRQVYLDRSGNEIAIKENDGKLNVGTEFKIPRVFDVSLTDYGQVNDPVRLISDFNALKPQRPAIKLAVKSAEAELQACLQFNQLSESEIAQIDLLKSDLPKLEEAAKLAQKKSEAAASDSTWQDLQRLNREKAAFSKKRVPLIKEYKAIFEVKLAEWEKYSPEYQKYLDERAKWNVKVYGERGWIRYNAGVLMKIDELKAKISSGDAPLENAKLLEAKEKEYTKALNDQPVMPIPGKGSIARAAHIEFTKKYQTTLDSLKNRITDLEKNTRPDLLQPPVLEQAKREYEELAALIASVQDEKFELPSVLATKDPAAKKAVTETSEMSIKSQKAFSDAKEKLEDLQLKLAKMTLCQKRRDYVLTRNQDFEATMARMINRVAEMSGKNPQAGTDQAISEFLAQNAPVLNEQATNTAPKKDAAGGVVQ